MGWIREPVLYRYRGHDLWSQFLWWAGLLATFGAVFMPGFRRHSMGQLLAGTLLLGLLVSVGLRSELVVRPGGARVIRKWFFLPFWWRSGDQIDDAFIAGQDGHPGVAFGLSVVIRGAEVIIGTPRSMGTILTALKPALGQGERLVSREAPMTFEETYGMSYMEWLMWKDFVQEDEEEEVADEEEGERS